MAFVLDDEPTIIGTAGRLTGAEAHDLCYPFLERISVGQGLCALAFSGDIWNAQGITASPASSDVALWCDPETIDQFAAALGELGWTAPKEEVHGPFTHPAWDVKVRLADRHPLLDADPDQVFQAVWQTQDSVTLSGIPVACCSVVWSVLLAGAELLAGESPDPAQVSLLIVQADALLDENQRAELAAYAGATGLQETLEPLLTALGQASLR
jgi:hypothetical protein